MAVVYSSVTGKTAIMSILRALNAYKKTGTSFYTKFYTAFALSKYLNFKWFGVLPGREIVSQKRPPK